MHVLAHHTVDAESHQTTLRPRLDVNVARPLMHRVAENQVRQLDDRRRFDFGGCNGFGLELLDNADSVGHLLVDTVEERIHRPFGIVCGKQRLLDCVRRRELEDGTPPGGKSDRVLDLDVRRIRGRHDEMPLVFAQREDVKPAGDAFWKMREGAGFSLLEIRLGEAEGRGE